MLLHSGIDKFATERKPSQEMKIIFSISINNKTNRKTNEWRKCTHILVKVFESCNLTFDVHMLNTWHYSNREIQIPWCTAVPGRSTGWEPV